MYLYLLRGCGFEIFVPSRMQFVFGFYLQEHFLCSKLICHVKLSRTSKTCLSLKNDTQKKSLDGFC
jgi:hypothetical protein